MPSGSPDRGPRKEAIGQRKIMSEKFLHSKNGQANAKKLLHRPDFFTWMRAFDPGGLGHIVGESRGLGRHPPPIFYSAIR